MAPIGRSREISHLPASPKSQTTELQVLKDEGGSYKVGAWPPFAVLAFQGTVHLQEAFAPITDWGIRARKGFQREIRRTTHGRITRDGGLILRDRVQTGVSVCSSIANHG